MDSYLPQKQAGQRPLNTHRAFMVFFCNLKREQM